MVGLRDTPHPDTKYDRVFASVLETREKLGKASLFPSPIKTFAYNSWARKSLSFSGTEGLKQLDHDNPPQLITLTKFDTEGNNTFHHIFPKAYAKFLSAHSESVGLASEYFPLNSIRKLIIRNYNHPINCLPILDSSHALLHNPMFNDDNYISWQSLYDTQRSNASITNKISFHEISNILGVPNWFYQYDNLFFTMNIIAMRNFIKKQPTKISEQYILDINNAYALLMHERSDLFLNAHKFLFEHGIIEQGKFEN